MKLTNKQIKKVLEEIEKTKHGVCNAIAEVFGFSPFPHELSILLDKLYKFDEHNPYNYMYYLGPKGKNKELRATAFLLMVEYFELRGEG